MKIGPRFEVNPDKCIRCGCRISVCVGMVLKARSDDVLEMQPSERYGWRGYQRYQHCLAVCPTSVVSIFGKRTGDSLPPLPEEVRTYVEGLIVNHYPCHRYRKKNVNPTLITRILKSITAASADGNYRSMEYTVIDGKDRIEEIRRVIYKIMEKDTKRHIYTDSFGDSYYAKIKESEQSICKDNMLFCGTPHLSIAHAKQAGE